MTPQSLRSRNAVGRLAPSPTGAQHLGNARTYLLGYWSARSRGARLIFRTEDLDSPRVKSWAAEQAIQDLRWLGIDWDEGPDVGGTQSSYIQSERMALYQTALQQLIHADAVYPCTCSRTDIVAAAAAPHEGEQGPIYPGTCAAWHRGNPRPPQGSYCWRFRSRSSPVEFVDALAGHQKCSPGLELGDFPITRKTGLPAYQLAVVVDDAAMGITEVVRGDDLLPSTFWQLELYEALGLTAPSFAHVPLVTGPDGRRLAKRHGDTRLSHLRELGLCPLAVVQWAAVTSGLLDLSEGTAVGFVDGHFQVACEPDRQARLTTPEAEREGLRRELEELHRRMIERFDWPRISRQRVIVEPITE